MGRIIKPHSKDAELRRQVIKYAKQIKTHAMLEHALKQVIDPVRRREVFECIKPHLPFKAEWGPKPEETTDGEQSGNDTNGIAASDDHAGRCSDRLEDVCAGVGEVRGCGQRADRDLLLPDETGG